MSDEPGAESDSPWALQIAVRVERTAPPTTSSACAATTLATIALLDHPAAAAGGEWHEPITTWNGARIRKLVRRARASAWDRAQTVAGVTVEVDGAEARAFVPSPMDSAPSEITKLQIRSTPLDEVTPAPALPAIAAETMVIAITPHFDMSWGKQAAQCAHAGQRLWMSADDQQHERWNDQGRPILIVHPDATLWNSLDAIAEVRIHDGGFTEIPPGTNSSLAWWG